MFKSKKAGKPVILYHNLSQIERARRFMEIVEHPEDYLAGLRLIVETLRPTLFGRDVRIEYWAAGRPTSIFQRIDGSKANVRFQWTLSAKSKGTITVVHCILGDWYIGWRKIDPITLRKGDTFQPNWSFNLGDSR
jgi:hypothetical protein